MSATLAVARRELLILFGTPLVWVMLVLLSFVGGWLFIGRVELFIALTTQYRGAGAAEALRSLNLMDLVLVPMSGSEGTLLLLATPLLTMRLLADERSRGSYELLMSAPLRPASLVLGKYLALLMALGLYLLTTLAFPLSLAAIGTGEAGAVAWPTVLCGLLGLGLLGAALGAMGLAFSSLSQSQAVAALSTLVFSLLLFLAGASAPLLEGRARSLLMQLSAGAHLRLFAAGLLDQNSVLYFLGWILIGLAIAHRSILQQRGES